MKKITQIGKVATKTKSIIEKLCKITIIEITGGK